MQLLDRRGALSYFVPYEVQEHNAVQSVTQLGIPAMGSALLEHVLIPPALQGRLIRV